MGAALGGVLVAAYIWLWHLVGDAPCTDTAVLGCTTDRVLILAAALPLLYLLWAVGLRLAGAPRPWGTPLLVGLVVVVLAGVTSSVGLPLLMWPLVVAVTSYGLLLLPRPGGSGGSEAG